jgi:hypothetical protein
MRGVSRRRCQRLVNEARGRQGPQQPSGEIARRAALPSAPSHNYGTSSLAWPHASTHPAMRRTDMRRWSGTALAVLCRHAPSVGAGRAGARVRYGRVRARPRRSFTSTTPLPARSVTPGGGPHPRGLRGGHHDAPCGRPPPRTGTGAQDRPSHTRTERPRVGREAARQAACEARALTGWLPRVALGRNLSALFFGPCSTSARHPQDCRLPRLVSRRWSHCEQRTSPMRIPVSMSASANRRRRVSCAVAARTRSSSPPP